MRTSFLKNLNVRGKKRESQLTMKAQAETQENSGLKNPWVTVIIHRRISERSQAKKYTGTGTLVSCW